MEKEILAKRIQTLMKSDCKIIVMESGDIMFGTLQSIFKRLFPKAEFYRVDSEGWTDFDLIFEGDREFDIAIVGAQMGGKRHPIYGNESVNAIELLKEYNSNTVVVTIATRQTVVNRAKELNADLVFENKDVTSLDTAETFLAFAKKY